MIGFETNKTYKCKFRAKKQNIWSGGFNFTFLKKQAANTPQAGQSFPPSPSAPLQNPKRPYRTLIFAYWQ